MIKLKEGFDVEFQDLIEMDLKFAYILDLFNITNLKQLITQREEILQTYLLDCQNKQEFEKKKYEINKYFDKTSYSIMESKFNKEEN